MAIFRRVRCQGCQGQILFQYILAHPLVCVSAGLWVADLSITQMFLETVLESERGVVNGVQTSLNQMMDMVKFVLVLVLPFANQFGLLVILSYLFVFTGAVLQGVFVYRERRQHEQSWLGLKLGGKCQEMVLFAQIVIVGYKMLCLNLNFSIKTVRCCTYHILFEVLYKVFMLDTLITHRNLCNWWEGRNSNTNRNWNEYFVHVNTQKNNK